MKRTSGVTLIELMVTVSIIGIGFLAIIASYRYISTSIEVSKGKTLGGNLVTEQIEKLKNLQYYSLLVTTNTFSDNRFSPPLLYDTGNYPAQSILQGGITFTRTTRVDFAFQSGTVITTAPWTSNDTGMKMLSVYVIWQDNFGLRYQEVHNLMTNPAANPLNATFKGTVVDGSANPIAGAVVKTIDNPNWFGIMPSAGQYQFSVSSGTYTLNCSSSGYFSTDRTANVQAGAQTTANFTLVKMTSGTVSGYAYVDNHLVVSEVVLSTDNPSVEYVELYNPTTVPVNIGTVWPTRSIDFYIFDNSGNTKPTSGLKPVPLVYVSTYVPSNKYYLIANSSNTIHVGGASRDPDAYYTPGTAQFDISDAGGTGIADLVPNPIDSVAWDKTAPAQCPTIPTEGTCIDFTGGGHGIGPGEWLIRKTDTGTVITPSFGRAYDSNNNVSDFLTGAIGAAPNSTARPSQPPLTGTPANGAYVTSNDPLSATAQCDSAGHFVIPGIATGTWTIAISTYNASSGNNYYQEVNGVQMTAGSVVAVPNAVSTPTWPTAGADNALLGDTTAYAFIAGLVTDANNNPLAGIPMLVGGKAVNTGVNGRYFVAVATGDVLIVANNANQNKAYSNDSNTILGTVTGQIYDNPQPNPAYTWFNLTLAGTLVGYFQTASLTALPGQTAVALNASNIAVGQAVSDNTGHFYLTSLSTGTYTIQPSLDSASSASPTAAVVTLSSTGTATAVSTFTVTNGLAEITGQVRIAASTAPISTGVLVIASTATLAGGATTPPPTLNGGLGSLCAPCYYGASSDSTGEYSLYVRSSTTPYQLYGWYTAVPGSPTSRKGPYTVAVSTAGTIIPQNILW